MMKYRLPESLERDDLAQFLRVLNNVLFIHEDINRGVKGWQSYMLDPLKNITRDVQKDEVWGFSPFVHHIYVMVLLVLKLVVDHTQSKSVRARVSRVSSTCRSPVTDRL
eukprot:jgi/Botrbrau1/15940/Bobra.0260s0002.1